MARPSTLPEWATTGIKTEPLTAEKQAGWVLATKPYFDYFNWWMNLVYEWILHLTSELNPVGTLTLTNNHSAQDVTGALFPPATYRGVEITATVWIDATANYAEMVVYRAVWNGAAWVDDQQGMGSDSGVLFSITAGGQVQHSVPNFAGFSTGKLEWRATTFNV